MVQRTKMKAPASRRQPAPPRARERGSETEREETERDRERGRYSEIERERARASARERARERNRERERCRRDFVCRIDGRGNPFTLLVSLHSTTVEIQPRVKSLRSRGYIPRRMAGVTLHGVVSPEPRPNAAGTGSRKQYKQVLLSFRCCQGVRPSRSLRYEVLSTLWSEVLRAWGCNLSALSSAALITGVPRS